MLYIGPEDSTLERRQGCVFRPVEQSHVYWAVRLQTVVSLRLFLTSHKTPVPSENMDQVVAGYRGE